MPDLMKLHVGGVEAKEGWKLLNIQPGTGVDYVGDIRDLSQFKDGCCRIVYGSHVLEHISQRDMVATLKGIRRILAPKGKLMISVPDLAILCKLFIDPETKQKDRFKVMRAMFGGQIDDHDFHYVGLSMDILGAYLQAAGFAMAQRIPSFGIFRDTSSLFLCGVPISLNVIATNVD